MHICTCMDGLPKMNGMVFHPPGFLVLPFSWQIAALNRALIAAVNCLLSLVMVFLLKKHSLFLPSVPAIDTALFLDLPAELTVAQSSVETE